MELKTQNLSKHFGGVYALSSVDLEFAPGKITAIIGPNGSGKTTLANLLTGITPFDDGAVVLGDQSLSRINRESVFGFGIGRTFQEGRLFSQLSLADNLLLALARRAPVFAVVEQPTRAAREKVAVLLEQVGLTDKRDALAGTLSYGQRKLLEIARVLALEPRIIFFDEPFAGLFPEMVERISAIMRDLREGGVTQILVEHTIELIRRLSDTVIVMDAGVVLAQGPADDVLARPEVIEAYLGK